MAPEKTDPEDGNQSVVVSEEGGGGGGSGGVVGGEGDTTPPHHDPYFEPVVNLPEITVQTNEEEEEEMMKVRCKLFRYHTAESPAEWKERGTGDVKILKHSTKKTVRLLMRQDKTLKIRANHYITPYMDLKPNCGSDRAWVWSVVADFADEEPKQELFAIRFANAENAQLFKEAFDEARGIAAVAEVNLNEKEEEEEEREVEEKEEEEESTSEEESKKSETAAEEEEEEEKEEKVRAEMEKLTVKSEGVKE